MIAIYHNVNLLDSSAITSERSLIYINLQSQITGNYIGITLIYIA